MSEQASQPSYKLLFQEGVFEIRRYAPHWIAEIACSGERKEAISKGFRELADYIFGKNQGQKQIAMTAPVTQITDGEQWKVRFSMPSHLKPAALPKPENQQISLKELPTTTFVSITFSGHPDEAILAAQLHQLESFAREKKLEVLDAALYAFYNRPTTPGPQRRNEILLAISHPTHLLKP